MFFLLLLCTHNHFVNELMNSTRGGYNFKACMFRCSAFTMQFQFLYETHTRFRQIYQQQNLYENAKTKRKYRENIYRLLWACFIGKRKWIVLSATEKILKCFEEELVCMCEVCLKRFNCNEIEALQFYILYMAGKLSYRQNIYEIMGKKGRKKCKNLYSSPLNLTQTIKALYERWPKEN